MLNSDNTVVCYVLVEHEQLWTWIFLQLGTQYKIHKAFLSDDLASFCLDDDVDGNVLFSAGSLEDKVAILFPISVEFMLSTLIWGTHEAESDSGILHCGICVFESIISCNAADWPDVEVLSAVWTIFSFLFLDGLVDVSQLATFSALF